MVTSGRKPVIRKKRYSKGYRFSASISPRSFSARSICSRSRSLGANRDCCSLSSLNAGWRYAPPSRRPRPGPNRGPTRTSRIARPPRPLTRGDSSGIARLRGQSSIPDPTFAPGIAEIRPVSRITARLMPTSARANRQDRDRLRSPTAMARHLARSRDGLRSGRARRGLFAVGPASPRLDNSRSKPDPANRVESVAFDGMTTRSAVSSIGTPGEIWPSDATTTSPFVTDVPRIGLTNWPIPQAGSTGRPDGLDCRLDSQHRGDVGVPCSARLGRVQDEAVGASPDRAVVGEEPGSMEPIEGLAGRPGRARRRVAAGSGASSASRPGRGTRPGRPSS